MEAFYIERSVFLFSLVYERALRGCLNNRNSVHFQPEVHGFFTTLKKHNKNYARRLARALFALVLLITEVHEKSCNKST